MKYKFFSGKFNFIVDEYDGEVLHKADAYVNEKKNIHDGEHVLNVTRTNAFI